MGQLLPESCLSNLDDIHRSLNDPKFLTSIPLLNHVDVDVSFLKPL